jgi:hypothetical protein
MTDSAAGPTSTVAAGGRPGRRRHGLVAAVATLAVMVAACSSSTPASGGPGGSEPAPTPASGGATAQAEPSPTSWPGNVPDAVIALGAFDEQMAAAAKAMDASVAAEDFAALSGASKGLVDLVDANAENVKTVQAYAGTKGLGDSYAAAMGEIRAGAQAIVDGVAKGDAAAINGGVKALTAGITTYGLARKALAPLLEQAISMKKKYVK